ncbi:MAG: methionyl-tRNA formyltransferase [Patescibacteria group bacterium]
MNEKINFAFFGTPDVASETLEILKQNGYTPSLIITSPDARKGRGLQVQESPVAIFAQANNIPCLKPEIFDNEFAFKLSTFDFQILIVIAYGKKLPEEVLAMPKLGAINVHYSLLPKYRGASPVESAILNGDTETGISIQKMILKMDAGPIIAQEKTAILPDEKAPDLRKRLIKIGAELLVKTLPDFINGKIIPIPQDENIATQCKKIKKEDGLVNLEVEPPKILYNKFRAYANWPRIFFFKDNKRVIITEAILEDNEFKIKKVLPEGKKEIAWEIFNILK